MNVHCIPASELTADQVSAWRAIQQREPSFANPFFGPELVQQTARARGNRVEVGILIDSGGTPSAFFPFHRRGTHTAEPFAGHMTGLQAVVTRNVCEWSVEQLLEPCGLRAWHFDHLLTSPATRNEYEWATFQAPYIDLSQGFETYRQERRASGTREIQEGLRKLRKVERDLGPVRFEPYCEDPDVLRQLLDWKADQLRHRKMFNGLAIEWVPTLLRNVLEVRSEDFAGMLSALFVGDRLAAATIGVRSRNVFHGWVTAFNPEFHRYSPGILLVVQLCQSAEQLGITRIDMGRGDESFKYSLASGCITLAEGSVDRRWLTRSVRKGWIRCRETLRGSVWGEPARWMLNRFRYACR